MADTYRDADGLWEVLRRDEEGNVRTAVLIEPSMEWKEKLPPPSVPVKTVLERIAELEAKVAALEGRGL